MLRWFLLYVFSCGKYFILVLRLFSSIVALQRVVILVLKGRGDLRVFLLCHLDTWQSFLLQKGLDWNPQHLTLNSPPRPFKGALIHMKLHLHVSVSLSETLNTGPRPGAGALTSWAVITFSVATDIKVRYNENTKEPHRSHFITDEMRVGGTWAISVLTICPGSFSGAGFSLHLPESKDDNSSWRLDWMIFPMAHLGQSVGINSITGQMLT